MWEVSTLFSYFGREPKSPLEIKSIYFAKWITKQHFKISFCRRLGELMVVAALWGRGVS